MSANEFEFKAEVQKVLSLVINSLYTNPEVFLRELISNGSDALDRARFLQLTDEAARDQEGEPKISVTLDKEDKTLTIEDNGIGMLKDEMIENLGTVAHSGTGEFAERLAEIQKSDSEDKDQAARDLIGQFGVGFYSVFMVASRVDVESLSMKADSEAVLWRSNGEGTFTVAEGERETAGTRVTVHLKEDAAEYVEKWRVEAVIKKYSDFVMFPIELDGEVTNQSSALWRQPRSQVTDEQHADFFKHLTGGRLGDEPRLTVHYSVDAPVQFSALVYAPHVQPPNMFQLDDHRGGLRLYARRVLIMEKCESLLPVYLRFIHGVVDSEDLQLNVSRETLQENRTVKQMEQQLTKQILKGLKKLSESDADAYLDLWKEFGLVLKEGLSIDFKNKDLIAELCRFETMDAEAGKLSSLSDYVEAKKEDQKAIYYITGMERAALESSPHLEVFRKKGIDVLLLCDPIDEWVVQALPKFGDLPLESVTHGELDLGDDDADEKDDDDETEESKDKLDAAAQAVAKALGDRVSEVRMSTRLTETASCLVSQAGMPGANLERLMKALDGRAKEKARILELNPKHPFVVNLATLVERDEAADRIGLWSEMLFDQALLSEGVIKDPAKLVKRIQDLLVESSNAVVDP